MAGGSESLLAGLENKHVRWPVEGSSSNAPWVECSCENEAAPAFDLRISALEKKVGGRVEDAPAELVGWKEREKGRLAADE